MEALNFVDKNPRILIDGGFANLILDMALSDPKKATVRAALLMLCRTQVEILPATLPYLALIRSYISVIFRLTRPVTIMKRKKFQKKMFESDSDSDSNSESSDDSSSTSDSSDDDDDDSSTASSDNPGSQTDEFSIIDEKRQLRSVLLYLFKVATYEDLIASNLFLSYKDSDPHCGPFYAAIISHCVENGKNELLQHLIENGMISMLLNKKVLIKSVSLSFLH